jgi:histidinol-phosphate aminotransferase
MNIADLIRPNIATLMPYSSARHEFKGQASIWLDANENSLGSPFGMQDFSRYPYPPQGLKACIADLKSVAPEQIFLGNGSDEAIDLLFRAFCEPSADNAILLPPTYGMYAVQGRIHGAELRYAPLDKDFLLDLPRIRAITDPHSKLIFCCSPNNPSGNRLPSAQIEDLLSWFPGIVVLDEAYIDFAQDASWTARLAAYPNLVILQTLSKAWGLAGLRIGMALAGPGIIQILDKIKYPYNISTAAMTLAEEALINGQEAFRAKCATLIHERERLKSLLQALPCVQTVYPSEANFLLVKMQDALRAYRFLANNGIVVRNRSEELNCGNCLRITVGSPEQNNTLIENLALLT